MVANTIRKPNRDPNTATHVNHTNTTMNNTQATLKLQILSKQQKLMKNNVHTNNNEKTHKCMRSPKQSE